MENKYHDSETKVQDRKSRKMQNNDTIVSLRFSARRSGQARQTPEKPGRPRDPQREKRPDTLNMG
jgi:hypothetical protein